MIKIMFVCHGNICRSPMAEFIFKDVVNKKGLEGEYYVTSSATSDEEIYRGVGNPVYPPAKRVLNKHGISCEGKYAVRLKKEDYNNYDFFIAMDDYNIRNINRIFGHDNDSKVRKLLDYCGGGDVADPWYSGDFETTFNDISRGVDAMLKLGKNL